MENDDDVLSAFEIKRLVSLIEKGKPDTLGSRRLLAEFCRCAKQLTFPASPFPSGLVEFVMHAFEGYLSGDQKDLERALGLKASGRPRDPATEQRNRSIAADVLRRVIGGQMLNDSAQLEGAFSGVAEEHDLSMTEIRNIYYRFQNEGMKILLSERLSVRNADKDSG